MEKWNKNLFLWTVRKSYMVLTGKISPLGVHRISVISAVGFFSISESSSRELHRQILLSFCNLISYHRYILLANLAQSQILRTSVSFSQITNKGHSFCYS